MLALACAGLLATTASATPTGVTVNGVALDDDISSSGTGWSYVAYTLTLSGAGPFTLSGTNEWGMVRVVVSANVTSTVTLSNLTLRATSNNQCAFELGTNANVSLFLTGTNTLASGATQAGLAVAAGRTLSITNTPGDEASALTVTGGDRSAGIGGGEGGDSGTVMISGGTVTALGGYQGAGIGGGRNGAGGTVTISGGTLTATGGWDGNGGAGIGGGYGGTGGTVTIVGGTVTAQGGYQSAGIGGGRNGAGGTVDVSGGTLTATAGNEGAGIGGGYQGNGGMVTISGGTVTASSGSEGAGIGGGYYGDGGTVTISGGTVTATSGTSDANGYAAGIGGGHHGAGGTVTVTGGTVTATGGLYGAGIGGGYYGAGGTVTISGGIVFTRGKDGGADIGPGSSGSVSGSNTFTGGSIRLANSTIAPAPSNGTVRVWCVTVPYLTPNAAATVNGLDPYNVNGLAADENGKLYLWLPNNVYTFTTSGGDWDYAVTVANADATAKPLGYITFSSAKSFKITLPQKSWNATLSYSLNTIKWYEITASAGTTIAANYTNGAYKLYFRGTGNSRISGYYGYEWAIVADPGTVACSGNIETLLDHATVTAGAHPAMTTNCFSFLFCNCTALSSAPALPATTLAEGCYYRMFDGCTGLTRAPALPATTLAESCYEGMFDGCTALTDAPALPATTLAEGCYDYMFYGCTALTNAPVLPATTLADHCYGSMFAGCTGLKNAPMLPATTLAESCYEGMFYGCTALTCAPALPATTLAAGCYGSMFSDCTALTDAPALPATTLAEGCYDYMFYGCTALTRVPELPATTLAKGCYMEMFYGCTGIMLNTEGPGMPWSIPANANAAGATNWNLGMFAGTGGTFQGDPEIGTVYYHALPPPPGYTPYITFSSANPFTLSLPSKSWNSKLYTSTNATDWNEITAASTITAGSADGVYKLHLRGTGNTRISSGHNSRWTIDADPGTVACSGNIETLLDHATVTAGAHPAMTTNCFSYLFRYCTALSSAPALPATTLAKGCYESTFAGCTALTNAPVLPATTLAETCYALMFDGCTGLTCAPELPATTLAEGCYALMFADCTGLTNAPALPVTTLAAGCYEGMFSDCTGLKNAPELPATTLADFCYGIMFVGCTALTNAPALPATTLADFCYNGMFAGCTALTRAPALPATTLAEGCYSGMFGGCTALTRVPVLPATTLAEGCYQEMFDGCTGIMLNTEGPGMPWSIPANANAAGATDWNLGMFAGTGGTFTGNPAIGTVYYYTVPPPPGYTPYITFSSANPFTLSLPSKSWNSQLYTSTNAADWNEVTAANTITAGSTNGVYKLYLCGTGNTRISAGYYSSRWTMGADPGTVACSGNIETLLDYATVTAGAHPAMAANCFVFLFADCTALSSAPALPTTTLADGCYNGMFKGCTGLTNAPALPAITLANNCYNNTFNGCTGLTCVPALPATTLADYCYYNMFNGCTALTRTPALPATTLAEGCYSGMFGGCTALTRVPVLPATTLAEGCYQEMFDGCTGIVLNTAGPGMAWSIPANAVGAPNWNTDMFAGTGGTFQGAPEIGVTYYLASGLPAAPAFAADGEGFVIGDGTATIKIVNAESGLWYTVYRVDDLTQTNWVKIGDSIQATGSEIIFTIPRDPTAPRRFFKVVTSSTAP
jgi:hypothetical protein